MIEGAILALWLLVPGFSWIFAIIPLVFLDAVDGWLEGKTAQTFEST